jgi:hypothetical protein
VVAAAGERPPTRTWLATVTPAGIVVGRGGIGVGVGVGGGVGVGVGGGGVGVGVGAVVVVCVVPSSAVADGLAASSTADRTPAAPHAAKRRKIDPRRLTSAV